MNKKRKIYLIVSSLILLITVISILLSGKMHSNEIIKANPKTIDSSSSLSKFSSISFSQLPTRIHLMENPDGGYGYLIEEMKNLPNLYTTYYGIKTKELLGEVVSGPSQNDYTLLKDTEKLPMTDIFYYCSIFYNKLTSSLSEEITNQVIKMKNKTGSYAASISTLEDETDYLPTYMAIYVIKITSPNYKFEDMYEWINKNIESQLKNNTDIVATMTNIKTLSDISILTETKVSESNIQTITSLMKEYEQKVESLLSLNKEPLGTLINLLEISDTVGFEVSYTDKQIIEYITKYKNKDGGYSFFINDQSNALSTYLAVKYLKKYDSSLLDKSKNEIKQFFDQYKLINGFYVAATDIKSDIVSTYYAHMISKILGVDDSNNIKNYLTNHNEENSHPYYWLLKTDINKDELSRPESKDVYDLFIKSVNSLTEKSGLNDFITIDSLLSILLKNNIPIDQNNKNKIIKITTKILEKTSKNESNNEVSIQALSLKIIKNFNEGQSNVEKKHITNIIQSLQKTPISYNNLFDLYYCLSALEYIDANTFKALLEDKNVINELKSVLSNYYVADGIFSIDAQGDVSNLKSTYFGLWLYEKFINSKS